jgi:hypothetical protein
VDVIAHSGGLGWDELVVFALPVVVLVVLQVLGRRKRNAGQDPEAGDTSSGGNGGGERERGAG